MTKNKQIGAKLQAIRRGKNIKQETVAGALGIERSAVSKIENGRRVITAELLVAYCHILDCTVNDVMRGVMGI
ncbi:MAG: helix-turn-helix transcriptional regulator [Chitinophagaceae bacterium]